jgi:ABC-type Fe3+/spermidine/putrescine transport system ATPase subunit
MTQPILQLSTIEKSFDELKVLSGITFDQFPGEVISLLGPSGCGKSTLLSIIAGIETPDHGIIYWNGSEINTLPPYLRGFGLMFQEDVLFPHMNVFENVAFGLRMQKKSAQEIQDQVMDFLELVGLQDYKDRDVSTLSGGEQQRVALARSLAPQPGLLMLDEPISSLDRTLREHLLGEIRQILKELHQTAIYVTHDQEEAFSIADRIILMKAGAIEQIGTPEELFYNPSTTFTANFLGLSNLIAGRVISSGNQSVVETTIGQFPITGDYHGPITLLIRPDSAKFNVNSGVVLNGLVIDKTFRGSLCHLDIAIKKVELKFYFLPNSPIPEPGEYIQLSIDPDGITPIIEQEDRIY